MAWSKKLTQLNDILADLMPHHSGIEKYVRAAGLRPQMIVFNGSAMDIWNSVLSEADKNGKVNDLVSVVLSQYPENPYLLSALEATEIDYTLSPKLDDVTDWKKVDQDTLEVLTSRVNTMLPISFLENGIRRSRAVGKVEIKQGHSFEVGSGFLFKLHKNDAVRFMTNFHVLSEKSRFPLTRIIFNFELDCDGNSKASKSFTIDENKPLLISKVSELDVSIFTLNDPHDELKEYGYLDLKKVGIDKNDFVNIIQHPGGQMKQIALYHNIVTHSTERVVQYLTDTMGGSSGSPVFNSEWDIVAIHHSGGNSRLDEPKLPTAYKMRNEGISINPIIDFIDRQSQSI